VNFVRTDGLTTKNTKRVNTRKMPEIALNELQKALCKKAEAEGKKSFISHDLLFNFDGRKWQVINAHTGDIFNVLNK
jgi:hypothetical protein